MTDRWICRSIAVLREAVGNSIADAALHLPSSQVGLFVVGGGGIVIIAV